MIVNGYINYKIEEGGGTDPDTGRPIYPTISWSGNIPCHFQMNQSSSRGYNDGGSFVSAQYIVDIEMQELPEFDTIRIFDKFNRRIGTQREEDKREFSIVGQAQILELVVRIRIMV